MYICINVYIYGKKVTDYEYVDSLECLGLKFKFSAAIFSSQKYRCFTFLKGWYGGPNGTSETGRPKDEKVNGHWTEAFTFTVKTRIILIFIKDIYWELVNWFVYFETLILWHLKKVSLKITVQFPSHIF